MTSMEELFEEADRIEDPETKIRHLTALARGFAEAITAFSRAGGGLACPCLKMPFAACCMRSLRRQMKDREGNSYA